MPRVPKEAAKTDAPKQASEENLSERMNFFVSYDITYVEANRDGRTITMNRRNLPGVLLLSMLLVVACGRKTPQNPVTPSGDPLATSVPTEIPVTTDTPAPTVTEPPVSTPRPTVALEPPESRKTDAIRIALKFGVFPTEEESREINRILKEKGLPCEVEFVGNTHWYIKDQWEQWITEYGSEFDIAALGNWNPPNYPHMRTFAKSCFLLLNDYLQTGEGGRLRSAYPELCWKNSADADGSIYAVPALPGARKHYSIAINDRYVPYFESFDGTYASLRKIYDEIGDRNLQIVMTGYYVAVMAGYSEFCNMPYDADKRAVAEVPEVLYKTAGVCEQIHRDISDGILIPGWLEELTGEALVYIYYGEWEIPEGYTVRVLRESGASLVTPGEYGVLASCPRKELALRVLALCFSDPKIASILCRKSRFREWDWTSEAVLWKEDTERSVTAGIFSAFRPQFSEEEMVSLDLYLNDINQLGAHIYSTDASGRAHFNRNYTPKQDEPQHSGNLNKYMPGVEAMNREIKRYFEKGGQP